MTNHDEVQGNSAPRQDGPQPSVSNHVLARLADATVYDSDGDKVGSVEQVYIDDKTGRPSWVEVKTGLFGMREALVPLHDVDLEADQLRVPYSKDVIKDAPRVDADQHISRDEEGELHAYYRRHGWSGGDAGERRSDADDRSDDDLRGRHAASGDREDVESDTYVVQEGSAPGEIRGDGVGVAGVGAAGAAYAGSDHADGPRDRDIDATPSEYDDTLVTQERHEGTPGQTFGERSNDAAGESCGTYDDSTDASSFGSRGGETPVHVESVAAVETDERGISGDGDRVFAGEQDFGSDHDRGLSGDHEAGQGFAGGEAGAGGGWDNDRSDAGEDFAADGPAMGDSAGRRVSEFDEVRDGGYGIGSAAPIVDNAQPMGHPIRAWHDTMSFRGGEERDGEREPDVWFFDEQAAYNAGYHDAD
ncbi:PRC-barrel domain-containing protein [Yimella sp. cx-51]|uniref:PRC-barrel domain-containing protein n=1 Tax=Yimella sp. cx-51 TaxID=2770551 RepID=UPI001AD88E2F|nr:PRC-barrel domain-containing protein [Yimella sp. cx-51]QTH38331.1 PRC-barrel domain-containing protein [Yimella sp. cx-51]